MPLNVGFADRTVRIVVGLLLLGLLFADGNARWFGLIGLIPIVTGFIGSCPLYSLFGFSSHSRPQPRA